MLMQASAHEGCTDTLRESALEVTLVEKNPHRTGESNLPQRRVGPKLNQLKATDQTTVNKKAPIHYIISINDMVYRSL